MNPIDWILLAVIAAALVLAFRAATARSKNGGCGCGCGCGDPCCTKCKKGKKKDA